MPIDPKFAALASRRARGLAVELRRGHLAADATTGRSSSRWPTSARSLRASGSRATTSPPARCSCSACSRSTVLALAIGCIVVPLLLDDRAHRASRACGRSTSYFAGIGLGLPPDRGLSAPAAQHLPRPPDLRARRSCCSRCWCSAASAAWRPSAFRAASIHAARWWCSLCSWRRSPRSELTPRVIEAMAFRDHAGRIAIAVRLLAPIGLLMGMPFAIGMGAARSPGATTAFLWGINGATSVCASVFGVVIAVFFGISTSFWIGTLAYLASTTGAGLHPPAAHARGVRLQRRRTMARLRPPRSARLASSVVHSSIGRPPLPLPGEQAARESPPPDPGRGRRQRASARMRRQLRGAERRDRDVDRCEPFVEVVPRNPRSGDVLAGADDSSQRSLVSMALNATFPRES